MTKSRASRPRRSRVAPVSTTGKTALLLAADLFEDSELLYPLYRLAEEDVAVTVAGVDDRPVTGKKGHGPVEVDTTVDAVSAADFDALVIPGGAAAGAGLRRQREADRLHLPRRLGADLGPDPQGPTGDQCRGHPGRHGERRRGLGRRGHRGGWQPDLRADAG